MTDPIADMLTRIRNANTAMHDTVQDADVETEASLASILVREGYICGFTTTIDPSRPGQVLEIQMKYTAERARAHRRAAAASPSPGCGSTSGPITSHACSVAWASPCCRRARVS